MRGNMSLEAREGRCTLSLVRPPNYDNDIFEMILDPRRFRHVDGPTSCCLGNSLGTINPVQIWVCVSRSPQDCGCRMKKVEMPAMPLVFGGALVSLSLIQDGWSLTVAAANESITPA